jgi:hypothetical protein
MEKKKIIMWSVIGLTALAITILFAKGAKASTNSRKSLDDLNNENANSTNNGGSNTGIGNTGTGSNTNTATGAGCDKEGRIFTDHDSVWDYTVKNCKWHTRKKVNSPNGNWMDIHNNTVAVQRLEKKYGKI